MNVTNLGLVDFYINCAKLFLIERCLVVKQIVIIFWSFIFGEVIGAIGGALEVMTYKPLTIGIVAALAALITSNGINLLSKSDSVK